jgi:hypothetical protein
MTDAAASVAAKCVMLNKCPHVEEEPRESDDGSRGGADAPGAQ